MAASTPGRQRREAERSSEHLRTEKKKAAAAIRLERLRESRESCSLAGGGFQVSLSKECYPQTHVQSEGPRQNTANRVSACLLRQQILPQTATEGGELQMRFLGRPDGIRLFM